MTLLGIYRCKQCHAVFNVSGFGSLSRNALRKRIEEWMQELEQEFTAEYAYMGYALDDVLDYIDTAPTIEVKNNG